MSDNQVVEFPGTEIDVQWDGRLCIHVGECGNAAGELFVGGREPWCIPDLCSKAQVREIIERCPSGALSYRDPDGGPEVAAAENTVTVAYNGPLYAQGELAIEGAPADMPGVRYRAALCRCGASANKPFCDNSHLKVGFEDFGAVGERGDPLTVLGGRLTVKTVPDGPLLVNGNVSIRAASGRLAWEGTATALCRCGASENKPFCDGSHKKAGFKST
ncbi:CDGSH iron-sulfur domain-containing protein [uncultured Thiodictyon sp.]|uniref:CDGSH iron-sulfur domain-containing protein n=1 Tax=uncultured Thiodictyon sp. TaxID=1846217 RepID=UPI0025D040AA|nr:CDGSH iron-sulfur domain-containing protein [uncultured Thiodictyon sp.]